MARLTRPRRCGGVNLAKLADDIGWQIILVGILFWRGGAKQDLIKSR
ncbi:hypothetical protein OAI23_05510 [Alphaproteobacteria bacterium]|nr:hypothetical protein [Alphaproteobacteria bacterium]MDC1121057.1 hypothetical protein [Alphaproteobacteria bacterium]